MCMTFASMNRTPQEGGHGTEQGRVCRAGLVLEPYESRSSPALRLPLVVLIWNGLDTIELKEAPHALAV